MVDAATQTSVDITSIQVAALVEIGIQAFVGRDVGKLETCLKDIVSVVRELQDKMDDGPYDDEKELDIYEEYEKMTQLRGTRLPELIRNCISLEDNPQIFLLTADLNLELDEWRSTDDDVLCLNLIPEKLFRLMSTSQDLAVIKEAYTIMGKTIHNAEMNPIFNPLLEPGFVDILLRIGMQYPEEFTSKTYRMGIPMFLEDNFTTEFLGRERATAAIRKILNAVAGIIANDSSSPSLLEFGLKCFSSVSTADKKGELRIMINSWIQEALPRLTNFLDHPNHGVQAAAMEAFEDVMRSSPATANQVVDDGIFVKVAAALNREEFDIVGDKALRLLWICIRKKPEDWVIEGIFEAQIPAILTQRFLLRKNSAVKGLIGRRGHKGVAHLCIEKICEFIPLTLAKDLLESGTVMDWLNYIKEDPLKLSRFNILRAILKHLAPTLKNDDLLSFQALTQMLSETVGLDEAKQIEVVERPAEDLGIRRDPEYRDAWGLSTYYDYYESDDEDDEDDMEINDGNDSDSD